MRIVNDRFYVQTTVEEDKVIEQCYQVVNDITVLMKSHDCNEMINHSTGEVITYEDFCRMLGILSGLPYMTTMYKTK